MMEQLSLLIVESLISHNEMCNNPCFWKLQFSFIVRESGQILGSLILGCKRSNSKLNSCKISLRIKNKITCIRIELLWKLEKETVVLHLGDLWFFFILYIFSCLFFKVAISVIFLCFELPMTSTLKPFALSFPF